MSYLDNYEKPNDLYSDLDFATCSCIKPDDLSQLDPTTCSDLTILQLNIRGLLNKQDLLKNLLQQTQPDILLICETWLTTHTQDLVDHSGYKCYHKHRKDRI